MYELWRAWALGLAALAPVLAVDLDVDVDELCEEPLVQAANSRARMTPPPIQNAR